MKAGPPGRSSQHDCQVGIAARFRQHSGAAVFALALLRAKTGTRGGGRTHNLRLRRPTLYPIELLAQVIRTARIIRNLLCPVSACGQAKPMQTSTSPIFHP